MGNNSVEIILSIISLIASGIGIYEFANKKIIKAREQANVELMKQRLNSQHEGLESLLHSIDAIVQIPKHRQATTDELQDLARVARAQAFILRRGIKQSKKHLDNWRFGNLIQSEDLSEFAEINGEINDTPKNGG